MATATKHPSESPVKTDNVLAWDGQKTPFHESYDIKIIEPKNTWSLWIRYGLCKPFWQAPGGAAFIWAIYHQADGHKVCATETFPLDGHDIVHTDKFIAIDNSSLSLAEAVGLVNNGKNWIKWELVFEDPEVSLNLIPDNAIYQSLIKTRFAQPRLVTHVSGNVYVNHVKKQLKSVRATQSHTHGAKLPSFFSRASCVQFQEDPNSYFEALSLPGFFNKKWLPPLHFFHLATEGQVFRAKNPVHFFLHPSRQDFDHWNFTFFDAGLRFEGKVSRNPRHLSAFCESSPNHEKRYCYFSLTSDITIHISQRKKGTWQPLKTLSCQKNGAFETTFHAENKLVTMDLVTTHETPKK